MSDPCIKEGEIGELSSTVKIMKEQLLNGDSALVKIVPVLAKTVGELNESVKDLRTVISGFKRFENEEVGKQKKENEIKKQTLSNFQIFGIIIGAIVGLCTIFGFVLSIKNTKHMNSINDELYKIDRKLYWKQDRIPDSATRGGYVHYEIIKDSLK